MPDYIKIKNILKINNIIRSYLVSHFILLIFQRITKYKIVKRIVKNQLSTLTHCKSYKLNFEQSPVLVRVKLYMH